MVFERKQMESKRHKIGTHRPTDSVTIDGVRMMTHTEYIVDEERWKDDLQICEEHPNL